MFYTTVHTYANIQPHVYHKLTRYTITTKLGGQLGDFSTSMSSIRNFGSESGHLVPKRDFLVCENEVLIHLRTFGFLPNRASPEKKLWIGKISDDRTISESEIRTDQFRLSGPRNKRSVNLWSSCYRIHWMSARGFGGPTMSNFDGLEMTLGFRTVKY